eukprot:scaffold21909_cov42-Phaeocystis_antarctica.AAC.2
MPTDAIATPEQGAESAVSCGGPGRARRLLIQMLTGGGAGCAASHREKPLSLEDTGRTSLSPSTKRSKAFKSVFFGRKMSFVGRPMQAFVAGASAARHAVALAGPVRCGGGQLDA